MTSKRPKTTCRGSACRRDSAAARRDRAAASLTAADRALEAVEEGLACRRAEIRDQLARLLKAAPSTPKRREAWERRVARLEERLAAVDQCHPRRRAATTRPILLPWPDLALPSGARVRVTGRVLPLSSLITSHDPTTWERDPRYPAAWQERRYDRDPVEQAKVARIAADLRPDLLLARTPSALDGPPVVMRVELGSGPRWLVLGGNGRTMGLRLAAERGRADAYEGALRSLTRRALPVAPVLVRELSPDDAAARSPEGWSRELNRALGAGLDLTASAVSLSRSLPPAAVSALAGRDLAVALRGAPGREALRALQTAGLVGAGERALYEDEGLSEQGRALVRRALVGALLGSADAIDALSPAAVDVFARSAASFLEAAAVGGERYDLRPAARAVAEDLGDATAYQGGIERWIADPHLLTPATLSTPGGPDLLRALAARTLPEVADAWLAEAKRHPEGQADLFGSGPEPIDALGSIVRETSRARV